MNKRIYLLLTAIFAIALIWFSGLASPAPVQGIKDPLPSWNNGRVKQSIVEFAYQEPDNASLNAAKANGWQIIRWTPPPVMVALRAG